jgi:serine-type D-Ala-D-Ala carboxypeptidase/endopeptidase
MFHYRKTMKRFLFLALLIVCTAFPSQAAPPPNAEIKKILAERIDVQHQNVGIVVGVLEADGTRRVVGHGTFGVGDKRAVDGDTLFEIGSATKVFTALLLTDAVARGEVALTDPVAKFLPAEVRVPERGGKKITLQDLSMHVSALPRLPSNFAPKDGSNPYADYSVQQLYEFLSGYELPRDIGSQYEYSNLAVGLLGHVLARRAGMDYETLVKKRITQPLGMKSTTITLSDAMKARLAIGHDQELARAANWDIPTLAGAGALRSSANDLLDFLTAFLGMKKTPLAPAMAATLQPRKPAGSATMQVALGWHVLTTPGGREIIWHNGGTGGYRSFIGFDPKARVGVVALSNTSTAGGVDDIGRHLLDASLPLTAPPARHKEVKIDPKLLDAYVGRYELGPNFILAVTREGDRLFTQATGQAKFEVFPESDRKFFVKAFDAQITFDAPVDGRSPGVTLHQGGTDMRAKRYEGEAAAPRERKEIAVDAAILDRYVGRYQLAPNFVLAVTREGDQLFAQATGQPRFPLFAETEKDFFFKVVDAQVTFVADETGKVTKLILHQAGDHEAKRIE